MSKSFLFAVLCVLILCSHSANAKSPNIILILTDDQGWSQLSETMDPRVPEAASSYLETPHMTQLMNSGMRFTSGYSPAPLCTPTRRCILCGTSAARSGPEFKSNWVPSEHLTIPKSLKSIDAKYRCAHFGKWGEQMISTPEECGYDVSDGMTGNNTGGMPRTLGIKGSHNDGPPHFIDNVDPKRTRTVTDRALEFMKSSVKSKSPFYVQVSYYAQHLSVVTSEKMLEKYRTKGTPDRGYTEAWAAMMEELDNGVGRLQKQITDLGIEGETYVFFTADNGGRGTVPGGVQTRKPTNFPLTGAKHSLYEGGVRVPMIAVGPGIKTDSVCNTPIVGYDFLATFTELANGKPVEIPEDVDSVSFASLLRGESQLQKKRAPGGIVFHRPNRLFSTLRTDNEKLMIFWKRNGEIDHLEFYDLEATPVEEGHNLAEAHPERTEELRKQLKQYLESVNADVPKPQIKRKKK